MKKTELSKNGIEEVVNTLILDICKLKKKKKTKNFTIVIEDIIKGIRPLKVEKTKKLKILT